MFRLELLPAAHGDCVWVEWGSGTEVRRMLVDGGPAHTYPALRERILHLPVADRHFELLVVTHIDADHIEGVIRLLQDLDALGVRFERIWFNGRNELDEVPDAAGDVLGAAQGEYLGLLLNDLETRTGRPHVNVGLPERYAGVAPDSERLPSVLLPGGLTLTLLSPDNQRLLDLKDNWSSELARANLTPGDEAELRRRLDEARNLRPLGDVLGAEDDQPDRFEYPDPSDADLDVALPDELGGERAFGDDDKPANGSSIVLLAEHSEGTVLLAGDAFGSVLAAGIRRLLGERNQNRLRVDAFKIPHHGSVGNLTTELLDLLQCRHYLISTSGAMFRHPHTRAVQLLIDEHHGRAKPNLHFNYRSETTEAWYQQPHSQGTDYAAHYPSGISLQL